MKKSIIQKLMTLSILTTTTIGMSSVGVNATSTKLKSWNNQWKLTNGNWNYIINGEKATGIQKINNKVYYFTNDGNLTNGWVQIGNEWVYTFNDMNTITSLVKGWQNIQGKWYFFNDTGYMAHDTYVDGYYLGSDGVWVK